MEVSYLVLARPYDDVRRRIGPLAAAAVVHDSTGLPHLADWTTG